MHPLLDGREQAEQHIQPRAARAPRVQTCPRVPRRNACPDRAIQGSRVTRACPDRECLPGSSQGSRVTRAGSICVCLESAVLRGRPARGRICHARRTLRARLGALGGRPESLTSATPSNRIGTDSKTVGKADSKRLRLTEDPTRRSASDSEAPIDSEDRAEDTRGGRGARATQRGGRAVRSRRCPLLRSETRRNGFMATY